jgi:hypothetical protein
MIPARDKNGRFLSASSAPVPSDPAAVDESSPPNASMPVPAAGQSPESVSILEQHQAQLASLRAEYEKLLGLAEKSEAIARDTGNVEQAIDAIGERLLAQELDELERELSALNRRKESLATQSAIITKQQHWSENVLQKRLPADIAACERLYQAWLEHVAERETRLLPADVIAPGSSGALYDAARTLALAGKVYAAAVQALGECGGVSYAWTRDLDPLPSDRPLASQLLFANDPLYAPPKRSETVANLLAATGKQLVRWGALLEAVRVSVTSGAFELPSYVEPEKPNPQAQADWNGPIDGRTQSQRYLEWIGKKAEDLNEYEKKILRDMEASNMSYLRERREANPIVMGSSAGVIGP